MSEVDLKEYDRVLNDYHSELLDAAFLSAHLLNLCLDHSDLPEWRKAACHMMCKRLVELAEALPFPQEGAASIQDPALCPSPLLSEN